MIDPLSPTTEQQFALQLFASGENLAIEAGAGTGKTSTLLLLARSTRRCGQYVAFNRAIVKEAGAKFPSTVNASTAHSLAFRAVGHIYADRLRRSERMRSLDIANRLGIDAIKVLTFDGQEKLLSQSFLAGVAMRAAIRFCQSADPEPTHRHVPWIHGLDPIGPDARKSMVNADVARHLQPAIKKIWSDWTSIEGGLPYRHDAYLKLWQLSEPRIGADYILFDECQDANPVMAAIVFAQEHAQLVFVGDSQQQIYAFTGAVNSLARIRETACSTAFLTQSFRFGQAVADVANGILGTIPTAEIRLRGADAVPSVVAPVDEPDAILTRTNAAAIASVLEALGHDRRVALVGGTDEFVRFAKAARLLMRGERTDHPELACFDTWSEVCSYVSSDEQGGDLRLLVKLISEFGVETILERLQGLADERDADLIVSTAHKAKGREWDSVQLGGDFPELPESDDERRLLYVAITRARRELDVSAVKWIVDGFLPVAQSAPTATTAEIARKPLERVVEPNSDWIGEEGERVKLEARVEYVKGMSTRFGWTYLTKLVDADGNQLSAFLSEELISGTHYSISAKIKRHEEFRGIRQTALNYVVANAIPSSVG